MILRGGMNGIIDDKNIMSIVEQLISVKWMLIKVCAREESTHAFRANRFAKLYVIAISYVYIIS